MTKKNQKRKKWWLLLLLLLLLGGGYAVYHYFFESKPQAMSVISGDFLPDGKDAKAISDKELASLAQQKVDESNFNMMISSSATIDAKTQEGALQIKNPTSNAYPINVEIREDGTNKLIYTSGAIQPGEEVSQIKLEQALSAGTHKATATFSLYDSQSKKKQGEVSAGVTLNVK